MKIIINFKSIFSLHFSSNFPEPNIALIFNSQMISELSLEFNLIL